MAIPNLYGTLDLAPTGWPAPLPSHIWHCFMTETGDGSGGNNYLMVRIRGGRDNPPCSCEGISLVASTSLTMNINIQHGGLFSNFQFSVGVTSSVAGLYYHLGSSIADFPGKGKIRPRNCPVPIISDTPYVTLGWGNVNGTTVLCFLMGYIWDVPLKIEPWHPSWGVPSGLVVK